MKPRGRGLALLVACACFWPGGPGSVEIVDEAEIRRLGSRIERFYGSLEGRSLAVRDTFDDPELRAFFSSDLEFSDYYAGLADAVRRAGFRQARALRVEVLEFRFEGPDHAVVDIAFTGQNVRRLRFWEISVTRSDTWRLRGTTWVVSPEAL
jgi:hypothetical protein